MTAARSLLALASLVLAACAPLRFPPLFDEPYFNDRRGLVRSNGQQADLVFLGTIVAVGPPPRAWSGFARTFQAVTYSVERVYKGRWSEPTITILHGVVKQSRHASSARPGLDAQIFQAGRRLIVFTERIDPLTYRDFDENVGTIPFSVENERAVELLL